MMKYLPFFLIFHQLCAQTQLPQTGKDTLALKPKGWKFVRSCSGDLNNDKLTDLVVIYQDNDTSKIEYDEYGYLLINSNPRLIGIYFADANGIFNKQFEADNFIKIVDVIGLEEPLSEISISNKGVLKISMGTWYNMGTWESTSTSYEFKYNFETREFDLVKYLYSTMDRASGEGLSQTIDFVKKTKTTNNFLLDKTLKKKKSKIGSIIQIPWTKLLTESFEIDGVKIE